MLKIIAINVLKSFLLTVIIILTVLFSTGQEARFIYTDF